MSFDTKQKFTLYDVMQMTDEKVTEELCEHFGFAHDDGHSCVGYSLNAQQNILESLTDEASGCFRRTLQRIVQGDTKTDEKTVNGNLKLMSKAQYRQWFEAPAKIRARALLVATKQHM